MFGYNSYKKERGCLGRHPLSGYFRIGCSYSAWIVISAPVA